MKTNVKIKCPFCSAINDYDTTLEITAYQRKICFMLCWYCGEDFYIEYGIARKWQNTESLSERDIEKLIEMLENEK